MIWLFFELDVHHFFKKITAKLKSLKRLSETRPGRALESARLGCATQENRRISKTLDKVSPTLSY